MNCSRILGQSALVFFALHSLQSIQATPSNAAESPQPNVILLTLDGVRWEEVFHGVDPGQSMDTKTQIFEFLTGALTQEGPLLGNRDHGEIARVSNPAQNSLPAYQGIMAGSQQPCTSNSCGRIQVETFPERLVKELGIPRNKVAAISSWEKIKNAVEHDEGTIFTNAGKDPMILADGSGALDPEAEAINGAQENDAPPWYSARYDKYTMAHAINYLKKEKPRFLFISLNDSDEWGHKGKYDKYVNILRQQDAWIKELVTTLDSMGDYGRQTTLIITTDHGRGSGNDWSEHGSGYANSGSIWIYGRSPYSRTQVTTVQRKLASERSYTHNDIRPTIEAALGLKPSENSSGKAIESIVGKQPVKTLTRSTTPTRARTNVRKADRSRPASRPST